MNSNKAIHQQKEYGLKKGAEEFPLMVVISFVYVCNAKCPNCPYNNSEILSTYKDALFMPDTIFKKIADECGQHNSYMRISGGGEPTLHPQAIELLLYAKAKGVKLGLITNGSRFSHETLSSLISAGIDNIEFSVDAGDKESYGLVRPGLDWDNLVKNVKMAVDVRNKLKASTRIIASIINQTDVDVDMAEKYWSQIVDNVQIRKYLTWGYNEDKSADSSPYLPPEDRVPCPWLFERLNIDTRGDATICGEDIAFDYKFANIKDISIKSIWNGSEFKEWRKKHLERHGDDIEICNRCPDWQYRSWNHNYWKLINKADEKIQKEREVE